MQTNINIPITSVLSRMEKHRDALMADLCNTSWFNFKRRYILSGAVAAYNTEINALLELGGKTILGNFYEQNH